MFRYRAFDLTIESDVAFGELMLEYDPARPADVSFLRCKLGYPIQPMGQEGHFDFDDPGGVVMIWPGAIAVRIAGPDRVEFEPYPDVPENYLAFPLLGPVFGWLLHMRGLFVLHASAVARFGKGVAFLGDKRAGKSTTATAFLAAGSELLTDDLLAVDTGDAGSPRALPAFPQIKLDATSSGASTLPNSTVLPLVMDGFEKRQVRLKAMRSTPIRPDFIFVLERGGDTPSIRWFDSKDSLAALIRYNYIVRFSSAPVNQQERARSFRQAVSLTNDCQIGCLQVPAALDEIKAAVSLVDELIEAHGP